MNKELKNKLNSIIDQDINKENQYNSDLTINKIEEKYNKEIPKDYKEFLLEYGVSFIKDNVMYQPIKKNPVTPEDGFDSIGYFFGLTGDSYDIKEAIKAYQDIIENSFLPIADADGGDLICLGIKEDIRGKVYYWYHEDEIENNFYLIANSFKEFIFSFKTHERENKLDLDEIEISLDEDLLND
ncbi:SMI1/KNR4 family protein [Oceanobacillus kimchii]|uniref:SMI1/KNR4 family protein n=1 Tax=Oceanobacillus kimchii TaxID=746691 RepID=UPI00098468C6|nr:SMI1/KNR4 family protein [Oceanobacillus kimchii]